MANIERSGPGTRDDGRIRIAAAVGAAVCMGAAMLLAPVIGISGFWPGTLAIVVAIIVGIFLGRLVGGMLFGPSSGTPRA
jgi:hypothetical protein